MRTDRRAQWGAKVVLPVALLATSAVANAANLVNKGGTSDVPTYEGRVYYIKPAGASCPAGFNCFCNSGTNCTLPGSGTVTGTVVIDRPGVTLDCQNRTIQPPRYAGTRQECTGNPRCGNHATGTAHQCVNGFCQLSSLAGINVGGPLYVDDAPINIDVNATGYVQDVSVVNCVVKNFTVGYEVDGSTGDNGLDYLDVSNNELRTNSDGLYMFATDASYVSGNYVHDNLNEGMDFHYNWSLEVASNTSVLQGYRQIIFTGSGSWHNRWLNVQANFFQSQVKSPANEYMSAVSIWDLDLTAAAACQGGIPASLCDMYFDSNEVRADDRNPEIQFRLGSEQHPTVSLRTNTLRNSLPFMFDVDVRGSLQPRCWNKGNTCYGAGSLTSCDPSGLFAPGTCWY